MSILIHGNMSRGRSQKGWAEAFHSFSFGDFLDPARMGFARLRVLNEDRIVPGAGFAPHDHADMDILTLVLAGRIRHEDSLGTVSDLVPGMVMRLAAGERLAADGEIICGASAFDQSLLTGESEPVPAGPGTLVHAGTLNADVTMAAWIFAADEMNCFECQMK